MNRNKLFEELRRDEGCVLSEYKDTEGYSTIGVGRLIDRRRGGGISTEEAEYLLSNDVARVERDLDAQIPWWRQLDDARQRALANMTFNLGVTGLLRFQRMLDALNVHDYEAAAAEALDSHWARQVGQRAERIAAMIRYGEDAA